MSDRIRFGEPIELVLPPENLPATDLLIQSITADRKEPFQVYILEEAHCKAWQHAREFPNVECGGVLMGHPFQTPDKRVIFIVIVDVILQHSDNRSVGHFTVSPKEVAESRAKIEQEGYFSVGWYHTHPGHGVFLSGQDMTIVRGIYNSDWHVAWVIDPVREEESFFQGAKGEKLSRYYLIREEPEFVKANAFFVKAEEARKAGHERFDKAKRLFGQLKTMLDDPKLNLAHWKETGRYQEVEDALRELLAEDEQVPPDVIGAIESSSSDDLLMRIPKRYSDAETFLREALREQTPQLEAMSKAKQILMWVKEKSPGYKEVDRLTDYSERIVKILESARPRFSLKDRDELEKLSASLRRLLHVE